MDTENQAGTRGLKLATDKGLAVVVMEPLMGGRLADPPPAIREMIAGDGARRSAAQLALDWVWDQPEVSVVLSGMSTMDQVADNLRIVDLARVGKITEADHALIARIREHYHSRISIPCTQCGYCMPCPNDVNIPVNFDLFNYACTYDDVGARDSGTSSCSRKSNAQAPVSIAIRAKGYVRNTFRFRSGCLRWRRCWAKVTATAGRPADEQGGKATGFAHRTGNQRNRLEKNPTY